MPDDDETDMSSTFAEEVLPAPSEATPSDVRDGESIYDIPVKVSVVLGSVSMQVRHLLKLGRGAVVELDRKVGEAIDIYANNRLIARGEIMVIDDRLALTITEVIKIDKKLQIGKKSI